MRDAVIALGLIMACTFFTKVWAVYVCSSQTPCTKEYIASIHILHPDKALRLLDEAERRQTIPRTTILEFKSRIYRNRSMFRQAYRYAKESFHLDSMSQTNPEHLLKMNVFLAELSNSMSLYGNSMQYTRQGMVWAHNLRDPIAEARLLFCLGENKYALHHPDEAYTDFNRAIRLLHGTQDPLQQMTLSHLYGLYMGYLISDTRLQEALDIAERRKQLLESIAPSPQVPPGFIETQSYCLYAKLAYICLLSGQDEQADNHYKRCLDIKEGQEPGYSIFTVPYLNASGQYDKAIEVCKAFRNLMKSQQDTLSIRYVHALQQESKAYFGKQKYKEAATLRGYIIAITDSISQRNRSSAPAMWNQPGSSSSSPRPDYRNSGYPNLLWTAAIATMLFALLALWKYRNRPHTSAADCADRQPDSTALPSPDTPARPLPPLTPDVPSAPHLDILSESQANQLLFHKLDTLIRKEQLYLLPAISRSELVRKLHINNSRFARMIKENTGTNLNGYLNELRLDYAIGLLKEHPEYTLKAIAEASGIHSMPTFHQLFKEKFGMTPAEFKSRLEETGKQD